MKFDASALADQELIVLESTLRVQLAVAKHVRAQQLTTAVAGVLLTGGVSAILSGPSIVCSTVLRRKCQRRHRACCRELFLRNVALAPIQETAFSKRALALSVASGLTCCVLGFSLDVLVDGAVLQVVAFFFSSLVEDRVTERTTGFVHAHAAELVGRDHVYVLNTDEPFALFGPSSDGQDDTKGHKCRKKLRPRSLIEMPLRAWKNASWSFSSSEMQAKIRDAKRMYRSRPSLHGSFSQQHYRDEENDEDDVAINSSNETRQRGAENWAFLFAPNATDSQEHDAREHETLFGCRVRATGVGIDSRSTTLFGTSLSEFAGGEEELDLVRSDAFSLFGDCYVVRVRQASTIVSPSTRPSGLKAETYEALFESSEPAHRGEDRDDGGDGDVVVHTIPCEPVEDAKQLTGSQRQVRPTEKSLLFTGDEASCAFWDGIWCQDDEEDEDVEYGVQVWALNDDEADEHEDKEPESGVEVWEYDDSESLFPTEPSFDLSPLSPLGYHKHTAAAAVAATITAVKVQDEEVSSDAFSLFGSPKSFNSGVGAAYHRYEDKQHEVVDELEPHQLLFG